MEKKSPAWMVRAGLAATCAYLLLAAMTLTWGALTRFRLPQTPVVDPDIPGYLGPALHALQWHRFLHIDGRSSAYPAFIYVILRVFGDFRAIGAIQHGLGLCAGAVILLAWNAMLRFVPAGGIPRVAARFMGLWPAMIYLGSSTAIHFEQQIRPEAIFPLLSILDILIVFLFIDARFLQRNSSAIAWGGLNVFITVLIYELKPSFGFAVISATAPVWVSMVAPGATWKVKGMLVAAAILPAALLLYLPEKVLKSGDPMARYFLPETLFTIHASLIQNQMTRDLDENAATPFTRTDIQAAHDLLATDLQKAATTTGKAFPILGYNPDFLMYSSFCLEFPKLVHWKTDEVVKFYDYYYLRTLERQPGAMWHKVIRQMHVFYNPKMPVYRLGQSYDLSGEYAETPGWVSGVEDNFGHYAATDTYLQNCFALAKHGVAITESKHFISWTRFLASSYLGLFAVALLAPLLLIVPPLRRRLFWLVVALWIAYSYNVFNSLTVAVIHSLEVMRYVRIQLIFTLFAECFTVYFILEVLTYGIRRLYSRTSKSGSLSTTEARSN